MAPISAAMLNDLEKETVDFKLNYEKKGKLSLLFYYEN